MEQSINASESINMPKRSDVKDCPQCRDAITMGFFFKVCKTSLSGKIDCKGLSKQLLNGEISPEGVIEKIKEAAKDNPEALDDIREIEQIRNPEKLESQ